MKPSDQPVYPTHTVYQDCGLDGNSGPSLTETIQPGLTLRQHYAGLALHAMLLEGNIRYENLGRLSVSHADAVIAELERTK